MAERNGGGFLLLVRCYRLMDNLRMDGQSIEIIVNGETREVARGASVADLINDLDLTPQRLAIELNLSILPRAKWSETELRSGDKLEIVHFVGGG
jgi:thiamine biosynthesis protein ThiS